MGRNEEKDIEALKKLKEDLLSEIDFLKARLEKERTQHQEEILKLQTQNIALRTQFQEREKELTSKLTELQKKLEQTHREYEEARRTWEEILKNKEQEKNAIYAELAIKESEAGADLETEKRKFFEREGELLKEIDELRATLSETKKQYEEKLKSLETEKREIFDEFQNKISNLR